MLLKVGMSGLSIGRQLGEGAKRITTGSAGRLSNAVAGHIIGHEIMNGEHDEEIGLDIAKDDAERKIQEARREIAAKVARKVGHGIDKKGAEIVLIKEQIDQQKK